MPDMSTTVTRDIKNEITEAFHQQNFDVARDHRAQAIAHFEKVGLPGSKQEEYRFTPITKSLEKNFNWNTISTVSTIDSIDNFLIPDLNANILVFVNGRLFSITFKDCEPGK